MATQFTPFYSTLGGLLIGMASVLMMLGLGRIAGISGVFGSLLTLRLDRDFLWRAVFMAGLPAGALLAAIAGLYDPASVVFPAKGLAAIISGFIVGAGTALGGGCTSGHGICGLLAALLRGDDRLHAGRRHRRLCHSPRHVRSHADSTRIDFRCDFWRRLGHFRHDQSGESPEFFRFRRQLGSKPCLRHGRS